MGEKGFVPGTLMGALLMAPLHLGGFALTIFFVSTLFLENKKTKATAPVTMFLMFFIATDPATSPFTYVRQGLFGIGLGVLTVLIQMHMAFLGGSVLALLIMNLTSPLPDRIRTRKTQSLTRLRRFPENTCV